MSRPEIVFGTTRQIATACGNMYITINSVDGKIYEAFIANGKAGTCARAMCETIGRLISIAIRKDADIKRVVKSIAGITCGVSNSERLSCPDAIANELKRYLESLEKNKDDQEGIRKT